MDLEGYATEEAEGVAIEEPEEEEEELEAA